jgi:hypothetical protein
MVDWSGFRRQPAQAGKPAVPAAKIKNLGSRKAKTPPERGKAMTIFVFVTAAVSE